MEGRGGVDRNGGLLPDWNGCSSRCIGLGRLGERGGLDPEVFPASSLSLREKSIAGGSRGKGLRRRTLSKALGWWVAKASSSGLRCSMRWGSK